MSASGYYWIGARGGYWGSDADWAGGKEPNSAAAAAYIDTAGSYVVDLDAAEHITLASLDLISGPTLDILGTLTLGQPLTGAGTIDIGQGGTLSLAGTVKATIANDGLISDRSGLLELDGPLYDSGKVKIASGGTLVLASANSSHVVFGGPNATLELNQPAGFHGLISGFEQSDTIALVGVTANSLSLSGSVLNVLENGATVDTIQLATGYGGASFSLTSVGQTAMIFETGITYAVEGQIWSTPTITWSFATSNYAGDTGAGTFTDTITQTADQAVIEAALSEWASVTGLVFVQEPDTATSTGAADLRIGWSDFSGSEIGETDYSYSGTTFNPDVLVRLEDPAQDPLNSVNGTLIYSSTETSLMQLALHEIGHGLGLAHTNDPDAIMYPVSTATNRVPDASDIAGLQALYAGDLACFAAGTAIATPTGDVAVERLRAGDRVVGHRDERARRIVWMGHRTIDCAAHPDPQSVWPVRIRAHAFARGRPGRDLLLSPDHAVFDGVRLIPVKYLIDDEAVAQVPVGRITYWHVELEAHDILRAEGLPAESYLDTGNRAQFVNAFAPSRGLTWDDACAPLCLSGPPIARLQRLLARRRHLIRADGQAIYAASEAPPRYRYLLPRGTREINIDRPEEVQGLLIDGRLAVARKSVPARGGRVAEVLYRPQA